MSLAAAPSTQLVAWGRGVELPRSRSTIEECAIEGSATNRWSADAIGLVLLVLTATIIALVIVELDRAATDAWLVTIGGLSGAATSSIAGLIQPGGRKRFDRVVSRNGIAGAFVPIVAGFAAGAFSVLAVVALFTPARNSNASAALLGGLYGLLLGGWANVILTGVSRGEKEASISETEKEASILAATIADVGRGLVGVPPQRYDGFVRGRFSLRFSKAASWGLFKSRLFRG